MDERILKLLEEADAIVIGAGAGLSTAAGLAYSGDRFERNFKDYINHYGMTDMYSAGFYPFETQEEKWGYWSKHIYHNRYEFGPSELYKSILEVVKDKEYFVITTNVDHQFYLAGFNEERVFPTQGDYGLFQCSKPCHDGLYSNEEMVKLMIDVQKDLKIPSELIPKCPKCGENMTMNLRADETFVQGDKWDEDHKKYEKFIVEHQNKNIVFLELGVGMNTPGIIKYPFWRFTNQLPNATYICLNKGEAYVPQEIKDKSISLNIDIGKVFYS